VLASGKTSHHYFDCELTTTYARALPLIGQAFFDRLLSCVQCVGGPTRGADPIADATAYYSVTAGRPVDVFSVRKELKIHGLRKWIDGSAVHGSKVALVDDVVTSGKSVVEALTHCTELDLDVVQIIVLVDREEQGGMQRIRDAVRPGVMVEAIFSFSELQRFWNRGTGQS
jgi:orotate phosphoribosyltransferase